MGNKTKSRIKCPGRFSGFREHLHNEAVPLVLEDRTTVEEVDLQEMWELVSPDIYRFDTKDRYYESATDPVRKPPNHDR